MMADLVVMAELLMMLVGEHPDVAVLLGMSGGAYYEIHHGRIALMAENQHLLGMAVYKLMQRDPDVDAEEFREDMWGNDNGGYHPGDWESEGPDEKRAKP